MITSNRRIFLAITLSFLLFFGIKYLYTNPQILRPENIYAAVIQKPVAKIKTIISSIRLPDFTNFKKSFTLNFSNSQNSLNSLNSLNNQNHSFTLPTVIQPTTSNQQQPTIANRYPTTKYYPSPYNKPSPTRTPTAVPRPTAIPRPTAVPTPTPKPIGNVRPGNSLQEIAELAQKYSCTPAALILAVKSMETGESFFNVDSTTFEKYNTYNWWNNVASAQEICKGYGYNVTTGLIPPDSKFAGTRCQVALGDQSYTGKPMGIMGLSDFEANDSYGQRIKNDAHVTTVLDRRVLFDAMIFAGYHFKNISLERSDNCDSWDLKYIAKTACKYLGRCSYQYQTGSSRSGDYCSQVCEKYNQFAGTSYDCSSAASYVDSSCNFK